MSSRALARDQAAVVCRRVMMVRSVGGAVTIRVGGGVVHGRVVMHSIAAIAVR